MIRIVSLIQNSRLMYWEIIADYFNNLTKHKNPLCCQDAEFVVFILGGTLHTINTIIYRLNLLAVGVCVLTLKELYCAISFRFAVVFTFCDVRTWDYGINDRLNFQRLFTEQIWYIGCIFHTQTHTHTNTQTHTHTHTHTYIYIYIYIYKIHLLPSTYAFT